MHYWIDSEPYTQQQSVDDATDELMATPAVVAAALLKLADPCEGRSLPGRDAVKVHDLCEVGGYDAQGRPAHELVAVILNATRQRDAMAALMALRELLPAAMSEEIDERAAELLRERNPAEAEVA